MKKFAILGTGMLLCSLLGSGQTAAADYNKLPTNDANRTVVYRLYNPNTGEHFYTTGKYERDSLISAGWQDEKIGWYAPTVGVPVYRLYNSNAAGGDHYYTMSSFERDSLLQKGWKFEGTGWKSGGDIDVFVAYNPNAKSGAHNYTTGTYEQNHLLSIGWEYGATAWRSASLNFGTAKLPAAKVGAGAISTDIDAAINEMKNLVAGKGDLLLGTRVMLFQYMGMNAGSFDNGVYAPGSTIDFKPIVASPTESGESKSYPIEKLSSFYSSSFYPKQAADGESNETAVLTATGWYLLPDIVSSTTGLQAHQLYPDLTKFIQTGNPSDLTSYTDGSPLQYSQTDQFGVPVLIS